MEKRKIRGAILVEGRYDAARLANIVDGMILTTDGFAIYNNTQEKKLLQRIAREMGGLTILTDSDAAGFRIRTYVTGLCTGGIVRQAYIPAIEGKEKRKAEPGKEGLLGVEGVPDVLILKALEDCGAFAEDAPQPEREAQQKITYYDLTEWGISGGEGSADRRREFLKALGLPPRLSKKAILDVLNELFTREQIEEKIKQL